MDGIQINTKINKNVIAPSISCHTPSSSVPRAVRGPWRSTTLAVNAMCMNLNWGRFWLAVGDGPLHGECDEYARSSQLGRAFWRWPTWWLLESSTEVPGNCSTPTPLEWCSLHPSHLVTVPKQLIYNPLLFGVSCRCTSTETYSWPLVSFHVYTNCQLTLALWHPLFPHLNWDSDFILECRVVKEIFG